MQALHRVQRSRRKSAEQDVLLLQQQMEAEKALRRKRDTSPIDSATHAKRIVREDEILQEIV